MKYAVIPCKEKRGNVHHVSPRRAAFWGLYKRDGQGCLVWVSDHTSKRAATYALGKRVLREGLKGGGE